MKAILFHLGRIFWGRIFWVCGTTDQGLQKTRLLEIFYLPWRSIQDPDESMRESKIPMGSGQPQSLSESLEMPNPRPWVKMPLSALAQEDEAGEKPFQKERS